MSLDYLEGENEIFKMYSIQCATREHQEPAFASCDDFYQNTLFLSSCLGPYVFLGSLGFVFRITWTEEETAVWLCFRKHKRQAQSLAFLNQ